MLDNLRQKRPDSSFMDSVYFVLSLMLVCKVFSIQELEMWSSLSDGFTPSIKVASLQHKVTLNGVNPCANFAIFWIYIF